MRVVHGKGARRRYIRPVRENGMRRRHMGWFAILALVFALETAAAVDSGEDIVLGATLPLSGEFENYGQSAYYGVNVRVRQINAAGGVGGRRIRILFRDNRGDPELAKRDLVELVGQHNAVAIIGPLLSDAAIAVRDLAAMYGVVVVSPMASSDAVVRGNPWMFRVGFGGKGEAEGIVDFQVRAFGAERCAVIYDQRHAFAMETARQVGENFKARGGRVTGMYPMLDESGTKDLSALLKRVAGEKPDFIFCASYALEATEIIHAARDAEISTRFCAPSTWDNELVFEGSGRRLAGTCITSSLLEKSFNYRPFQTFYDAMAAAGMESPDGQAANAYDAVSLIAKAMEKGVTSDAIREGLLTVKRLPLATGRVSISADGSAIKTVIIRMVEVVGSHLVPVYAERFDPK